MGDYRIREYALRFVKETGFLMLSGSLWMAAGSVASSRKACRDFREGAGDQKFGIKFGCLVVLQ